MYPFKRLVSPPSPPQAERMIYLFCKFLLRRCLNSAVNLALKASKAPQINYEFHIGWLLILYVAPYLGLFDWVVSGPDKA